MGLLVETPLDEKDDDHGAWYVQSADRTSWSKPSKLPVDGPRTTNPPLDVAVDSRSRIVAVFGSNSGSGTTVRNDPALSRSNDGAQWKSCGPGKPEGGDFGPQPATLWQEPGENRFHEGMLPWHEH
jgi:hypothetical protein